MNINRHPEADPSIKLADYLFSKDWTPEKLSSVFKTTKNLQKGLGLFGADVSNAMRFILGTIHILRKHFYSTKLNLTSEFKNWVFFVKTKEFIFQHYILTKFS